MNKHEALNVLFGFLALVLFGHLISWFYKKIVIAFRRRGGGYMTNHMVDRMKAMGSTAKPHNSTQSVSRMSRYM